MSTILAGYLFAGIYFMFARSSGETLATCTAAQNISIQNIFAPSLLCTVDSQVIVWVASVCGGITFT